MTKVVIKLDKQIRKRIAAAFVSERFQITLQSLSERMNLVSENCLSTIYSKYNKDELHTFVSECNKVGIQTKLNSEYSQGVIANKFKRKGNQTSLHARNYYEKNHLVYKYNQNDDFCSLCNIKQDNNTLSFIGLNINFLATNELLTLESDIKNLEMEMLSLQEQCYQLLSKVRTVDNLLKNWSDSYKYLPEDLEVSEPQTLSLSEKFALL